MERPVYQKSDRLTEVQRVHRNRQPYVPAGHRGGIAHATMLAQQGIITPQEGEQIIQGLQEVLEDIEAGRLEFTIEAEDVHMNVETFLTNKIGDVGKKLHTARSRNDQVALDVRLYLRDEIGEIRKLLLEMIAVLTDMAAQHIDTIKTGYTHLQRAQPITLAHHLIAYVECCAGYRRLDAAPSE